MTSKIIYTLSLLSVLICVPTLAQEGLVVNIAPDIYTNPDLSKVIKPGQVFIKVKKVPYGGVSALTVFTLQDIESKNVNIDWTLYKTHSVYGRQRTLDVNSQEVIAIIDDKYYYAEALTSTPVIIPQINDALYERGLDTISKRARFIEILNSGLVLHPYNFVGYLRPWIIAGIAVFLAVPFWFLMRRLLRG